MISERRRLSAEKNLSLEIVADLFRLVIKQLRYAQAVARANMGF